LRLIVIIYLLIYVWSYASIIELLPTSARQSLDYHRAIFSLSSLLFMLILAVGCLALKFASLAALNSDMAMRDWLTNLLNRRGFFAAIKEALADAKGRKQTIHLLAIDIDDFKQINDTEGHDAGDQVLQNFAGLLKRIGGENRIIARMGGEEFLITLFGASQAEALKLAEVIRHQTATKVVALPGQKSINFTISIGVHQLAPQEHIEQALTQADEALYKAKRNGRNQVAVL
jgi:diguanylate cyclase (GGDEF)-like protein